MIRPDGCVLVVDDDEDIRMMVTWALEIAGYRVVTATDGVEALEQLARDGRIGLILLDLMMPKMDGEQFLRTLRAGARRDVPVVIMSGHGAALEKADELAANGCLRKPVELDDLLGMVNRFLARPPGPTAKVS